MILAIASGTRGGVTIETLIIGLNAGNIRGLQEGMPIHVDGRKVAAPHRDTVIMAANNEAALEREVQALIAESGARRVSFNIPVQSPGHQRLMALTFQACERLGLAVAFPAALDQWGNTACADCGEPITKADGFWTHVDAFTEHGCRYGQGCAHPHLYAVPPTHQNQGEEQP